MARPPKNAKVDTSQAVSLTMGIIDRLSCPPGKDQVFLRDSLTPGLRVRVSPTGEKSYCFERKVGQRTKRRVIGDVRTISLEAARRRANEAYIAFGKGIDLWANDAAELFTKLEADDRAEVKVREAWDVYIEARKPKWGERHLQDHIAMVAPGGLILPRGRLDEYGNRIPTKPGPLYEFMHLRLVDLNRERVEQWSKTMANRKTQGRLAIRHLQAFLFWCCEQDAYTELVGVPKKIVKSTTTTETLGSLVSKKDALMKMQLGVWFKALMQHPSVIPATYLQVMLLTGSRPDELRSVQWVDLDFTWKIIKLRDKVDGLREIPMTPYVEKLLSRLPRECKWVFSSPTSASGKLGSPNKALTLICIHHGLPHITIHGLRRSFNSLSKWNGTDSGVAPQIMGHKPSATNEKHYTVRPIDYLREKLMELESWILDNAKVDPLAPLPEIKQISNGRYVLDQPYRTGKATNAPVTDDPIWDGVQTE